jgi:hypothetical protein
MMLLEEAVMLREKRMKNLVLGSVVFLLFALLSGCNVGPVETTARVTPEPDPTQVENYENLLDEAAGQAPFTLLVPEQSRLPFDIEPTGLEITPRLKTQPFVVSQSYQARGRVLRITQTSQSGQRPAKAVGETPVRGVVGYWVVLNTGERVLYWDEYGSSLTIGGNLADEDLLGLAEALVPYEADTPIRFAPDDPSASTPTPTLQPTLAQVSLPTRRETPLPLPAGLILEEYALLDPPGFEPLTFHPVQGSQKVILAKRYSERGAKFRDNSFSDEMYFSMRARLGGSDLVARQVYNETGSDGWVAVARDGEEIYRIGIGPGSPVTALRGLWVYDDHWVLETARITRPKGTQIQEGNTIHVTYPDAVGQISQDGELLNERLNGGYGYEEMFGFQLIAGRLFYFFKQDGKIGFSYDGQVVMAGYDDIPHYLCCSSGELNPVVAKNMVAFFAQGDQVWYYVEIGVYE